MNKKWLRGRYLGLPQSVQRVLGNERTHSDVRALQACLRQNPRSTATMSRLANALADLGRKRDALRIWRALFVGQRNKASLYFQRAHWAMIDRKFSEAEKYLRLCVLRDDGYFRETAHFWRAEALAQLGRVSAAMRELEFVSSDYCELWFFGRRRWSKADLLAQLAAAQ